MNKPAGFSLIELLIAIAIMGILLSLGIPAFNTYISNAKLRATAQSFLAGVQQARGEAVRRNANVDFVLTDTDFSATFANDNIESASGQNWFIRTNGTVLTRTFVEGKYGVEGSGRATGATSPVQVAGSACSVTFGSLGSMTAVTSGSPCVTAAATAVTFAFSNPTGGACAPAGQMRCLNVRVSAGGQARLCDPAATATGDTRGC